MVLIIIIMANYDGKELECVGKITTVIIVVVMYMHVL